MVFVRGNEIDPEIFVKIFNSTYFKTGISENKGPKIVNDDYTASFSLTNMAKDLDLAVRTASISGLTLPATASAHAVYRASEAFGLSKKDYTSVASFLLKTKWPQYVWKGWKVKRLFCVSLDAEPSRSG